MELDSLEVKIKGTSKPAVDSVEKLITCLGKLSNTLSSVNGSSLTGLANNVNTLGSSVKDFSRIKATDFNRIVKNIDKFSKIDSSKISQLSNTFIPLANGVTAINSVSFENKGLTNFINALTRLSNSNFNTQLVGLSQLGNNVSNLTSALSSSKSVENNTIQIVNAIARLASVGNNAQATSTALPSLGTNIKNLIATLSKTDTVSDSTIQFASALGILASAGNRTAQTASNLNALAVELKKVIEELSSVPTVKENTIQMANALANLANQGSKVGSASRSMGKSMNGLSKSTRNVSTNAFSLAKMFGKLYANYFLAIRGAKGLVNDIKDTTEYIEAYNYQAVAFGKIASEWDKDYEKYGYENADTYGKSFQKRVQDTLGKLSGLKVDVSRGLLTESGAKNLGLNIQKITQHASQLASVTNSLGQTGETTTAITKSMTMLAGDISSLFNVDYSQVAQNLQSGLIGQSRALYRYGIDITNATLSTYAYNLGISKSVSEMTQMEKQQLRVLAILDQSKVSWGDLANTINSPSNMMRQFSNNLKETGTVLGQLFIPMLTKVMPVANGVTIAIKRLLVNLDSLMGVKIDFESFGQSGYKDTSDGLEDISSGYQDVADSAKKATLSLMGFDEINKLNDDTSSSKASGGSGNNIDLTNDIVKAAAEYEEAWNKAFANMENAAVSWADRIEKILDPITKPLKKFAMDVKLGDWFEAGQDINQLVTAVFNTIEKIIDKVDWEKLGENIGDFLAGLDWVDILFKALKLKLKIWEAIAKVIKESFKKAPLETAIIAGFALLNYTRIGKFIGGQIAKKITIDTAKTVITTGGLKSAWETIVIKSMYALDTLSASTVIPVGIVASIYIASTIFAAKGIKKYLGNDSKLHKWFETEVLGIDEKGYVTTVTADCTRAEEGVSKLKSQIDGLKDTVINIDVNDKSSIDKANETLVDTINQKNIANKQFQQASKDYKKIQSTLEKYITKLYKGSVDEFYDFYGQTNDLSDMSQLYEVLTTIGSGNSKVLNQMYDELGTHNVSDIKKVQSSYNSLKDEIDDCNKTIAQLSPTIDESISAYEELNDTTYEYTTSATQHYHDMVVGSKAAISELTMAASDGANAFSNSYREAFDKTKLDGTNTFTSVEETVKALSQSAGINGGNQLYTMFDDRIANIPEATRRAFSNIVGQINAGNIGYDEGESLAENIMSGFNASAWRFTDSVQATLREAFSIDVDINADIDPSKMTPSEINRGGAINFGKIKIAPKYAVGGFPEDGFFYANHNELVGKFSNGKTAVANNDQITDGIKQAVIEGMSEVFANANIGQQNGNIVVQIDGQEVFRTTQRYANQYTAMTGQPAFNI